MAADSMAPSPSTASSNIIITEVNRRVAASILLAEWGATTSIETQDIISILSILKTLRVASTRAMHANRGQLNIFDIIPMLSSFRLDIHRLLAYGEPRLVRQRVGGKPSALLPTGRCLLRAYGDDDDDDDLADQGGPRPSYLLDIYPPFPRAYTFRRTETKGIRESDKVLIAKAKAEQQRQIESNLYRLLSKTNALPAVVNCEEEDRSIRRA